MAFPSISKSMVIDKLNVSKSEQVHSIRHFNDLIFKRVVDTYGRLVPGGTLITFGPSTCPTYIMTNETLQRPQYIEYLGPVDRPGVPYDTLTGKAAHTGRAGQGAPQTSAATNIAKLNDYGALMARFSAY